MLVNFSMTRGVFNDIIVFFGGGRSALLANPDLYRGIYVASDIWQSVGWGTIIYLSALSAIDMQLYEAAMIDVGPVQTAPAHHPALYLADHYHTVDPPDWQSSQRGVREDDPALQPRHL
jgi:hypothetical protein